MAKETEAPEAASGEATSPAAASGQGSGVAPGNGQGEQVWWKAPDGTAFKSPDELGKVYNDGLMMRKDYTQKTQTLAEQRRAFDDERKRFDLDRQEHLRRAQDIDGRAKQFEAFDRFVKQYPAKYKAWLAEIQKGPGQDDLETRLQQMFDEKYGSKLSEFEKWKSEQEAAERRRVTYDGLKSKYKDFDGDAIDKGIEELTAKLQAGDMGYLAERLYLSGRSSNHGTPEQIDKQKRDAELLPGSGKAPATPTKPARDFEEARRRAHKMSG